MCILSFCTLPVFAGSFEDAVKSGNNVFLYMYTPTCGYCVKFNPIYTKISSQYGNKYKFVKIDASTMYGQSLMRKFRARYVPFVVLTNGKTKQSAQIMSDCLTEYACVEKAVNHFAK